MGIVKDSVDSSENNMSTLITFEDDNEVDPELRYEESIQDISIATSIDELDFQSYLAFVLIFYFIYCVNLCKYQYLPIRICNYCLIKKL